MLKKIQIYFETHFALSDGDSASVEHQLNLAAAALLVEMTLQDEHVNDSEVNAVKKVMIDQLKLTADEAENLYALAHEERHQATDYHQFTRLIAQHYTQPQKIKLVEALWAVAFADNVLDKYEEHMVRRISDLIHVSHKDFIRARHRVERS
ncbi:MAG: TerB family tellurite resistance protein [Gammaproteobacteria bacterium]|nr:TerB family tellurite resistance protein [Gammaproteobacteria bacterium]